MAAFSPEDIGESVARPGLLLEAPFFFGLSRPPTLPVPSALALNPKAIVISGLSKVFGLAGLRLGWIVGPVDFIQSCKGIRYYTTLCPPALCDLCVFYG